MSNTNETTTTETVTVTVAVNTKITALVEERKGWEANELTVSNQRLYEILTGCYRLYAEIRGKSPLISHVDSLLSASKVNYQVNTSLPAKIIKLVFGAERRRNSAYSVALRRAHKDAIKAEDLAVWIVKMGGVDEIRLSDESDNKGESAQVRRARLRKYAVNTIVTNDVIASLPKQQDLEEDEDGLVLLMGVVQPSGKINIVQVVDKSLLPAALEKLGRKIELDGKVSEAIAAEKRTEKEFNAALENAAIPETEELAQAA